MADRSALQDELARERNARIRAEAMLAEQSLRLTQAEAELERATAFAEETSRQNYEFLADVSHELRTPLNASVGFAEMLSRGLDEGDPERRKEWLDLIASSGRHLLDVIDDLLDLSKIRSGHMDYERIVFRPEGVVEDVVALLAPRALEKGLELSADVSELHGAEVESDPRRVRQILINLVGNALKFTLRGSVRATARRVESGERMRMRVEVVDTGIGIPHEKLQRIFEPFVQGDSSISHRYGGTGLGLAISRRMAEAMGGGLWVESKVGLGSLFILEVDAGVVVASDTARRTDRGSIGDGILGAAAAGLDGFLAMPIEVDRQFDCVEPLCRNASVPSPESSPTVR